MTTLDATASEALASTIRSLQHELGEDFTSLGEVRVLFEWQRQDYEIILRPYFDETPAPKRATRKDHTSHPMPASRERLPLNLEFDSDQIERMKVGFIPRDMDDRWFIYFDGRSKEFRFHRSWTGFCIFTVKIHRAGEGYRVAEAWVNRDTKQYTQWDTSHDVNVVIWLIEALLLGQEREFPSKLSAY